MSPGPLTSLVQEPHEGEAGQEADGPPQHEQRDVPAGEAVGLARRVLDGAPGVPDQALREPQQREEQKHQPAAPVHPPETRGRHGQRRRRRHLPASPGGARRRPRARPQQRLPLLLAAPAGAHGDARPAGPLPSAVRVAADQPRAEATGIGGGRSCFGRPGPPGRAWCACAARAGPGLGGVAGAARLEQAGVPEGDGPPGWGSDGEELASQKEDREELGRQGGGG